MKRPPRANDGFSTGSPPDDVEISSQHREEARDHGATASTRRQFLASLGVALGGTVAGCGGTGTPEGSPGSGSGTDGTDASNGRPTPAALGPTPEAVGPWPQARADAGNTGFVETSGPTADPSRRWTTDSAGTVGAAVGAPPGAGAENGDTAGDENDGVDGPYVVSEDGRIAALDPAGEVRWRATLADARFPPAVGAGFAVVPQRERLTVFDAASGERVRSIELPGGVLYAPTLVGTRAYVGTFSNGVVAVDVASGETLWEAVAPSRAYPPLVVDGVAFATARRWETDEDDGEPGVLVALDSESGERLWDRPLDGPPTAPPGHHEGVVYAGTNRGSVYAVGAESGDRRWRRTVGDWVTRGPTAAADGIYVVVLGEGPVKLDREGGVLWQSEAGGSTNPVLTDDDVVLGTDDGVVAVDREEGSVSWRRETDAAVQFDARLRDGVVYAGDQYGTVVALDASSGDRRWEFPFRPTTMSGPVVGPRTVAGGSRDGGTYDVLATEGQELSLAGGAATPAITPVFLEDVRGDSETDAEGSAGSPTRTGTAPDSTAAETLLGGGTDGSLFRVRTVDYGESPRGKLRPTPTPTATPGPGEPTATPTPHIDFPKPEPLWERGLDVRLRSPITYADGRAYVGTEAGFVVVDPRNGQLLWQLSLESDDGDGDDGGPVSGAPAVAAGRVFVATAAGRLVAVDPGNDSTVPSDGENTPTTGEDGGEPSTTGEGDPDDGSGVARPVVDWEESVGAGVHAGPAAVDGSVFVADEAGRVSAYDVEGERRWRREVGGAVFGGPSVTDRRVFVGTDAGEVVALHRDDGSVAWRQSTDGSVRATPAVGDETVYAGDHTGTLWAFDATSGDVRWQLALGRWVDAPPALGHGAVFVADQTGRVYAVVGE